MYKYIYLIVNNHLAIITIEEKQDENFLCISETQIYRRKKQQKLEAINVKNTSLSFEEKTLDGERKRKENDDNDITFSPNRCNMIQYASGLSSRPNIYMYIYIYICVYM